MTRRLIVVANDAIRLDVAKVAPQLALTLPQIRLVTLPHRPTLHLMTRHPLVQLVQLKRNAHELPKPKHQRRNVPQLLLSDRQSKPLVHTTLNV
jgi:hypothetical protein